jgi:hypothetical protein
MRSITIQLTGTVADKLRQLSETEHRSEADIVGDALEAYAPAKRRLPTGAGKYQSGQPDLARNDEEILRTEANERRWP